MAEHVRPLPLKPVPVIVDETPAQRVLRLEAEGYERLAQAKREALKLLHAPATPAPPDKTELLTFREAARRYGYPYRTLIRLEQTGQLPVLRLGKSCYVTPAALDALTARLRGEEP